jgi:putative transcriptional regulator
MKYKALLSTPKIKDSFFHKTVILIVKEYNSSHMGLVLNKNIDESIKNFWSVAGYSTEISSRNNVKLGGPLFGSLMLLHKCRKYSDYQILENTYLSVHVSSIENALRESRDKPYEMFVGYCAWAEMQLENEIKKGSWWSIEPNEYMIFGNDENMWEVYKYKQDVLYLEKLKLSKQNWIFN